MKIDRITVIVCVLAQFFLLVVAAGAVDNNGDFDAPMNGFVLANIDWEIGINIDDDTPELIVAQNDDAEIDGYDSAEEFYFGPDEDKVRAEIEKKSNTLDPVARAHRDMKIYISAALLTTAITMIVLGILHSSREVPKDLYSGRSKYDKVYGEGNPVPLITVEEPYVPSIAAGISLAAGSVFLFMKK